MYPTTTTMLDAECACSTAVDDEGMAGVAAGEAGGPPSERTASTPPMPSGVPVVLSSPALCDLPGDGSHAPPVNTQCLPLIKM